MELFLGDCIEQLQNLGACSIDALVTDPPAGISFMNKDWDHHKGGRKEWIAWMESVMRECLRVLKPGAHGLVWSLPRTSHWTAHALEDAGFEIRDCIYHLFGSGFPKSLNVGKEIKEFEGWGTALKPAVECWWLVRKPISEKTVAKNVLKWGTGAINIDGCRIEGQKRSPEFKNPESALGYNGVSKNKNLVGWDSSQGRFPAHLILDDEAAEMLDTQSGLRPSRGEYKNFQETAKGMFRGGNPLEPNKYANENGGASRFFYCAKASKSERGTGNTHPTVKPQKLMRYLIRIITPPGGTVLDPFMGSGSTGVAAKSEGFEFIGIEKDPQYFEISEKRIDLRRATK